MNSLCICSHFVERLWAGSYIVERLHPFHVDIKGRDSGEATMEVEGCGVAAILGRDSASPTVKGEPHNKSA